MTEPSPAPPSGPPSVSSDTSPAVVTHRRGLLKTAWYALSSFSLWVAFKALFWLRVERADRVPARGAALVVANHQSHFDPPLIGGATRRQLGFLARDTLFTGVLGPLIRSYDAVPVDRTGSGLAGIRAILKRLKEGGAVLIFPEGTRSPDGRLQPLKPGFLTLVRRSGAPIVPVGIDGSFDAWPKGRKLPRLFAPISVAYGEPIPPERFAGLSDEESVAVVAGAIAAAVDDARRLRGGRGSA